MARLIEGVNADRRGGKLRPRTGGGGGGGSSFDIKKLLEEQQKRENEFLGRFRGAISGQEGLPSIFQRISTETGLPQARQLTTGLRQQALDVEGRLEALPGLIEGETRGFDVTAGQLGRIKQSRTDPVREQLIQSARAAERAGIRSGQVAQDVGQRIQFEQAEQARQLEPLRLEASLISDRAAREVTGYTAGMQNETDRLIAKMEQEGALAQDELATLGDLALQEDDYEKQKELIRLKTDENIRQSLALRTGDGGGGGGGFTPHELGELE